MKKVSKTRWFIRGAVILYLFLCAAIDGSVIITENEKLNCIGDWPLPVQILLIPGLLLSFPLFFVVPVVAMLAFVWGFIEVVERIFNLVWNGHWESFKDNKRRNYYEE